MRKNDNDCRFPDDSREEHGDRSKWPWLPATIEQLCGPDEWQVCVMDKSVSVLQDGRRAPRGTASRNLYYPLCFRDSSEIRRPAPAMAKPSVPTLRLDATPTSAVRRTATPSVRRGRSL